VSRSATVRVVVTGLGALTPLGPDVASLWQSLLAGRSGVRSLTRFDASAFPTRFAGQVADADLPELPASDAASADGDRIRRLAHGAAGAALADAGLTSGNAEAIGLMAAVGLGRYGHAEVFAPAVASGREPSASRRDVFIDRFLAGAEPGLLARRTPLSLVRELAAIHRLTGPVGTVMTACAAGTQAVGDALRWLRAGVADIVLVVGADSEVYPMGLASFSLVGALSRRNDDPAGASRPFTAGRDGFVLGEGGAALVLETARHAAARGARVYAEIAGFGAAADAFRATDPHPDGAGAALAMGRALADAGLVASEVSHVNAHGTSTVVGDRAETRALRRVFGSHAERLAVSASKSMLGHLTVAAGAVEAVITVLAVHHGVAHRTLNASAADPECDLDYVTDGPRRLAIGAALSNSFAFGGQCACLAVRRWDGCAAT
jgi:3-oxoacyl-[acyl-carrier-protein] synthase II